MINVKQLEQYPLFSGLSDEALENLANAITKHTFARNAYIFYPGNPGVNLYLIESGMVRLFMINSNGEEFLLNLSKAREVFGLPGLIGNGIRPAGAAAIETTILLTLSRADMDHFVDIYPQFARNLLIEMSNNLRNLLEYTRAVTYLSLNARLVSFILHMVKSSWNQADRLELELPLTQAELATWMGASRGRVNRELKKLQQLGLIDTKGQKLLVMDLPGLEHLAEW